jgi:hypothetical protein
VLKEIALGLVDVYVDYIFHPLMGQFTAGIKECGTKTLTVLDTKTVPKGTGESVSQSFGSQLMVLRQIEVLIGIVLGFVNVYVDYFFNPLRGCPKSNKNGSQRDR